MSFFIRDGPHEKLSVLALILCGAWSNSAHCTTINSVLVGTNCQWCHPSIPLLCMNMFTRIVSVTGEPGLAIGPSHRRAWAGCPCMGKYRFRLHVVTQSVEIGVAPCGRSVPICKSLSIPPVKPEIEPVRCTKTRSAAATNVLPLASYPLRASENRQREIGLAKVHRPAEVLTVD